MTRKRKEKLSVISRTLVMALISLLIVVPLLIVFLGSFKDSASAQKFDLSFPETWEFSNYVHVFSEGHIGRAFMNSLITTAGVVVIVLFASGLCAYVIARRTGRFSRIVYDVFLLGMIAPLQIVTTFALLKTLHLTGTYTGVIMVIAAKQMPWSIFMFSGFIRTVPKELDEAAFLDGATPFYTFLKVILPLLKPIVATTVVTTAMSAWNEFMVPLYFFNTAEKWTMPLTIYNFFGQYASDWNYVFADLIMTVLPILVLYLYCQKYIMAGAVSGAVKG